MRNMTTDEILQQLFQEKRTAPATQDLYKRSVRFFEKHTQKKIGELITIAKNEERDPNMIWGESTLRNNLISFRNELYDNFKESSASTYFAKIPTLFRHYGVRVEKLPSFSTKQTQKSEPIYPEDLPDREVLSKCVEVKNPLLKAATLLMSSTGLSRADTLKLKVSDYLKSTQEYHNNLDDPIEAIKELERCEVDVVPTFKSSRRKTGIDYVTFASPESVTAVNAYLLSRKKLQVDDPLFDISTWHFNKQFRDANDLLGLGHVKGVSRFTPQMLRRYHASQLYEAGMSADKIDILEGRTPKGIIHQSYIRIKTSVLKEEYIKALPFLVVQEIEKVRTELDVEKEKNTQLQTEVKQKDEALDNMNNRLSKIESLFNNVDNMSDDEILNLFANRNK